MRGTDVVGPVEQNAQKAKYKHGRVGGVILQVRFVVRAYCWIYGVWLGAGFLWGSRSVKPLAGADMSVALTERATLKERIFKEYIF